MEVLNFGSCQKTFHILPSLPFDVVLGEPVLDLIDHKRIANDLPIVGNTLMPFLDVQRLGRGAFGTVWNVKVKKTNKVFARKVIRPPQKRPTWRIAEIGILQRLQDIHIIKLEAYYQTQNQLQLFSAIHNSCD